MPYDWVIDHDTRTILVRGHGAGVTDDTLAVIAGLVDVLRDCAGYDFLYNAIDLRIESTPADMVRVANALFGEAGARFRRFAIVVPRSRIQLARIFAALADPHGVVADVFDDVDAARDWLATRSERRRYPGIPSRRLESPEQ